MFRKYIPYLLAILITLSFFGCGGGGGGSSTPKNSDPVTLSGPDGSTLTTPVGGLNGGATVQLSAASDSSHILDSGETQVSTALLIDTSDEESALMGDGPYSLSIPVDTSKITDTNKLTLKVKLTTGAVYPVFGVYDSQTGAFKVDLSGLVDGWVIAVVEDPTIEVIQASAKESALTRRWLTDLDWETYEWAVVNHTAMTEVDVKEKILPVMGDACEALANAGFRSPKIYIDPRLTPEARVVHLIGGIGPNNEGSHFSPGAIVYANGSWIYTEEQNTFDTSLLDDEEMSALGQMYVNYDQFLDLNAKYDVSLGNIVIHELFHSVQHGYDIRKSQGSLKAYFEGTATPVGQTFQAAASVNGPPVSVRILRPNEHARLYQAVDDPTKPFYYTKQDFFAYVSKRYGGNSFAWTDQLFEYMNTHTANKFGLTEAEYKALYRKAMDEAFEALFSKSLSKIYKEYAVDRAYEHDASYQLRPLEETEENGFGPNHLAKTLFKLNEADKKGFKELDPLGTTDKVVEFEKVEPLSTYVFYMMIPDQSDTEEQESFPLIFKLENGELSSSKDSGIKIVAFIEDEEENGIENGKIEITDVSKPVQIPFMEGGVYLTVLVMNCYVEDKDVKVTVSAGPYIEFLSPDPAVPGGNVTVTGVSFGATQGKSTLHFGNEEMTPTTWSDTEITFTLPATAESDKVKVTVEKVASNEVQLNVGETAGNWEMLLEIWGENDGCDDAMPHYWDFMRVGDQIPVTVTNSGTVSFNYTGSGSYYVNVGGSNLHVWGTGTFLNNTLTVSGHWTHQHTRIANTMEYRDGTADLVPVVETWEISSGGAFTADGHFDTIMGYWWGDDFSATYSAASSYVKIKEGEEVDRESDSCGGTIKNGLNDIADFKMAE